jgi:serine/threonine protein kinase
MLSDSIISHLLDVIAAADLAGTRYLLKEEIGRGGMGIVYCARDILLDRNVALKVLNSTEEALTLASLEHPGIVPVHDVDTLPDGRIFYAMKLIQGTRLDDFAAKCPSLSDKLRIFVRICEPVAFSHSRGVIHRDLKPANVMIGAFGEVLVLDWGIARRVNEPNGSIAGTRGYVAPEQQQGITNIRTDIYSLGKVLEYLLNADDPKAVWAVAAKASNADPQLRYACVPELAEDVIRFLDTGATGAYRESPIEQGIRWISRNKTLFGLILTYLFVRCLIFFLARR